MVNEELAKSLALMQHLEEDYFLLNGEYYKGKFCDIASEFAKEVLNGYGDKFEEWLRDEDKLVEELDNEGYLVLTNEEADEATKEYIKETIWAFNANFILEQCGLDCSKYSIKSIQKIQEDCECANDFLLSLVEETCGLDEFVEEAIKSDGRGHFLNTYDSEEYEETVNEVTYFIYQVN